MCVTSQKWLPKKNISYFQNEIYMNLFFVYLTQNTATQKDNKLDMDQK